MNFFLESTSGRYNYWNERSDVKYANGNPIICLNTMDELMDFLMDCKNRNEEVSGLIINVNWRNEPTIEVYDDWRE